MSVRVPDLEFRPPDCPVCGLETEAYPDSIECDRCGLDWRHDGTRGEVADPDALCLDTADRTTNLAPLHGYWSLVPMQDHPATCYLPARHPDRHAGYGLDDADRDGYVHEWRYWPREEVSA